MDGGLPFWSPWQFDFAAEYEFAMTIEKAQVFSLPASLSRPESFNPSLLERIDRRILSDDVVNRRCG